MQHFSKTFDMEKLLDAVAAVVCLVSPEKIKALATRVRQTDASKAAGSLSGVLGTATASRVVDQLLDAWRATTVSAEELALMLLSSGHIFTKLVQEQSTELVWTGPTTPFVSTRRTEQVLLQVINAAEQTLFITSFVAYDISTIVKALNAAVERGVSVSMLLELSNEYGGNIKFDAIGKMKSLIPFARLYAWRERSDEFTGGSVHAKVAVADEKMCFVTSANLTGHAMDRNMEAGLLLTGGNMPRLLKLHLTALISTRVVEIV
jgi:phosphatidylserine/phosphatidylglycerophosphate/cardiolipin synthase-like enzyme